MAKTEIKSLRDFPAVEQLLQSKELSGALELLPRPVIVNVIQHVLGQLKIDYKGGKKLTVENIKTAITDQLLLAGRKEISQVINATGIVVHTNLGRAPLSASLFDAVKDVVTGYGNVEFDTATGKRGSRGLACEQYLALLTGAESATVVNNCAAALFLILNSMANRKKVVLSRGELVQIGGGFKIPDILRRAGAKLVEIGTTNISSIEDYQTGIDEGGDLILKVHQSNFVQSGFTESVSLKALVELGKKNNIRVVNDLGSGVLIHTKSLLGYPEPTVQMSVSDGADLTCFSGDKMLGGVQAGLIVGKKDLINKLKKNPLFRALRVDKITFAMLEKLLSIYLNGTEKDDISLWKIISTPESTLYKRGKEILKKLGNPAALAVEATSVYIGGGALPQSEIPSVAITFDSSYKPTLLSKKFRSMSTPVIGRIENERFMIDLKAISENELPLLTESIRKVLS